MDELFSINTGIDIDAPPEAVLSYLADPGHAGCWLSGVTAARSGIRVSCLDRVLELPAPAERAGRPRTVTLAATRPFAITVEMAALPYGEGCRVLFHLAAAPGDFFGVPERVVEIIARRRFAADLVALRELVTVGGSAPVAAGGALAPGP